MFIEIDKPKNAIDVENWLKNQRESNGGFLSPEIVKEALSYTNNFANIKFMLKEINRFKTKEEKLPFKDVIFSMVTNRECSDASIETMKNIAKECDFLDEFERYQRYCSTMAKNGGTVYHARYPRILKVATQKELVDATYSWWDKEIQDVLICEDSDSVVICAGGEILGDTLPSVCIFPNTKEIELYGIKGIKQLKLNDDSVISFEDMNIPNNVEFEKCKECRFNKCSFANVENVTFREGADVVFYKCTQMPFRMDLSRCKTVRFGGSDFSGVRSIVLKNAFEKNRFKENTIYSPECEILTHAEFLAMEQMQKGLVF